MISKKEIKRLADLARIEISDGEAENLSGEMDAILDYVGQVSNFAASDSASRDGFDNNQIRNVMREDEVLHQPGQFSKELIAGFPDREGDYLKVKKIL